MPRKTSRNAPITSRRSRSGATRTGRRPISEGSGRAIPTGRARGDRRLTHVDGSGRLRMVSVSEKPVTSREAVARGRLFVHRDTLARIRDRRTPKGNVLAAAHLAGVMAAKRTSDIIPLAHPLPLEAIDLAFELDESTSSVGIEARVRTRARTGVEMEALTAVTVAALTLYDMLKAVDRDMVMGEIALWEKRGGRSGVYRRRA
jgi:cyclic pyranopterin phosphate synthase